MQRAGAGLVVAFGYLRHCHDHTISFGRGVGAVTWFPVHCTSINNTNSLISGDNKGLAAQLFEKWARAGGNMSDSFVAAFGQANVGDTSPNVGGAYCRDTGICPFMFIKQMES